MSYGLEVYNSQGNIAFSSEVDTLQILDYGQVTLEQGEGPKTISIQPTTKIPKIWISEISLVAFLGNPDINKTYLIKPTVGDISKNDSGEYISFVISADTVDVLNGTFNGGVNLPWTINYIVFV